ncbi:MULTISPECIES: DUF1800 domain-containing protein [Mycobacteriaceae]|jgi:uncharacterized protein (DUF1800 family)|uniref:Uncharacterized conserved protein, DUF1800 family n=1 Tax=Mycolicibacterium fluoranthenivorans TaxID=258505 RepID=A0A1G4W530_9MYCO|nr:MULTISPECIES: DUF1800 domain-containing protein [Mycobacteriaceae]MCV7251514.1 DUF1800 domain-containing protein [Mycobacterium hackensackense]SCX16875.1 Uncharacterized conserved protein, DUF1800 family [Mycolicibacterium fluoranthenivorans]
MLRRAGFGASGPQIDAVVGQDWSVYLDKALNMDPDSDPGALATPMPAPVTPPIPPDSAPLPVRTEFIKVLSGQMLDLGAWWTRRMAAVQEPIHEKLTLVWHNHFATSAEKVLAAELMAAQNQKLRTLKLGDFRELAYAMLIDAAMALWLDAVRNTKAAPNENLSREFMELFTLGHNNGYTEADVKEGARALTGRYVIPGAQTVIAPENHDTAAKTVFGVTGNHDDTAFCDIVLSQPGSPGFVAGKLWRLLASDTPAPPDVLDRLVAAYGPNRDLKALTKAVFLDPAFTASAGSMVTQPIEWLVGMLRSLAVPLGSPDAVAGTNVVLTVMGQRPFFPYDVGGWPRGQVWLSSTSTAARVWAADKFVPMGDISVVQEAAPTDRVDAAGYLLGIGAWSDSTAAALKPLHDNPVRLVAAAVNTPEYLTS